MKLTKRTATILLAIGVFTLFVWVTRLFVFFGELQAGTLPAPAVHLTMVVIYLVIGVYLSYLGVKGRRAARGSGPA
jgi:putative Ca2+/H+ antiporter (TMEM165/GDT1 family)